MTTLRYLLIACLLLPGLALAQTTATPPEGHHLTVFSEEGDRFFLVLDGERINKEPNHRVERYGLRRGWYKARIIFDNEKLTDINQNVQLEGVDPGYNEVVYAIKKRTRRGKTTYALVVSGFRGMNEGAPKGVTLEDETPPAPAPGLPDPRPIPGLDDAPKPVRDEQTNVDPKPRPAPKGQPCRPEPAIETYMAAIGAEAFREDKLNVAKQILAGHCFTTAQIQRMAPLFAFEDDRLAFVKAAYPTVADPANYFRLNSVFSFSSNKQALGSFIQSQRR